LGDGFAVQAHSFQVENDRIADELHRLLARFSRGNATGLIGNMSAEARGRGLDQNQETHRRLLYESDNPACHSPLPAIIQRRGDDVGVGLLLFTPKELYPTAQGRASRTLGIDRPPSLL